MSETSGEARAGGKGNVNLETKSKMEIGGDGSEEGDGESIEMRTARDAKAVPSRGAGEPLELHLTRDQLANLTLESRRIKVMHTNLTPKPI